MASEAKTKDRNLPWGFKRLGRDCELCNRVHKLLVYYLGISYYVGIGIAQGSHVVHNIIAVAVSSSFSHIPSNLFSNLTYTDAMGASAWILLL
jgi:hypothetical protein